MAHDRKFRFGVQVSQTGSAREWRDRAKKIEDLGYSTLFMPDHFDEELAPLPAMAMAAAHTTTLRVGALVFDNDYKHPVVLAKEAATIDLLSDGRYELGLGAGWMKTDYDKLGIPYDPPAVRVDRFEEAIRVIKGCFSGEEFSVAGEHYRVSNYTAYPAPVQKPGPPLLIGGGGKRVLSIAAREADIVGINPNLKAGVIDVAAAQDSLKEQTDRKLRWVREAAGARYADLEIQMRFFVAAITGDRDGFAQAMAPAFGVEPDAALEAGAALVGSENEVIEQLQRRREEWDLSYVVLGDDTCEQFAGVVAKLAGT